MMVKLAESIGRLVMAGRDFTRLAAYTTRVNQLIQSIEELVLLSIVSKTNLIFFNQVFRVII